jgi:hypothetical protein
MTEDLERSEGVPHNRQTRLADAALDVLREHPDYGGEKLIVFLDGNEHGAIGMSGYDDDVEAIVNLFMHLRAIFAAQGKELTLMGLGKPQGQG